MEAALWVCVHRDLDEIPDNRVVGVAVHLLLEESQRRATTTAAADVTQLVSGPGALLPLPNPQYLRRIVGGTECDQGRSEIYLKNWLPHGASPQQASMARRYVRDNIAGSSLTNMDYDANGMSRNMGCGAGLEFYYCRCCGACNSADTGKHLKSASHNRCADQWRREQAREQVHAASRRRTAALMRKVMLKPVEEFSHVSQVAYHQVMAGTLVTEDPSDDEGDGHVASVSADVTLGSVASAVHAAAAAAGIAQTAYSMAASAAKTPDPEPTTADIRGR